MTADVIYSQTAKGEAEIADRPGKLGPNLKTLLGMIDGKSSVADLQRKLDKVPMDRLREALQRLAADGYIHVPEPGMGAGGSQFSSFMKQPVRVPTVQQRQQAEQQTVAGMRSLKASGYFVNILNRPAKRIRPRKGEKYNVLILDGDQANSLVVARSLLLAQLDVRSATRKTDIMAELDKEPPDIIVMDVELPELVGLELLAHLREHPDYKSVPILIVTARAEHDDIVAALVYGASGYMTKPCKPETVLESVRAVLGLT